MHIDIVIPPVANTPIEKMPYIMFRQKCNTVFGDGNFIRIVQGKMDGIRFPIWTLGENLARIEAMDYCYINFS
jgi:hypothetical protein